MKNKLTIAAIVLLLLILIGVFVACDSLEQDLDGKVKVIFEFNGGKLNIGSTEVTERINHAYDPDSYVIDISNYRGYQFTRTGYDFVGWYTKNGTDSGDWGTAWNFAASRVQQDIMLYARWKESIEYTYGVYLVVEGNEPKLLGTYSVDEGDTFKDSLSYANSMEDRTFLGVYYSDKELTTAWDNSFTHPGGEKSTEIPVYIDSIEGIWTLVDTLSDLKTAISNGANIYLRENIDCQNEDIYFKDYDGELCGNNHTLSNISVANQGTTRYPIWSLFGELGSKANIHDVTFDNVHMDFVDFKDTRQYQISALAQSAVAGSIIRNVTVKGTYTNGFTESLMTPEQIAQQLLKPIYDPDASGAVVEGFSAQFELSQN